MFGEELRAGGRATVERWVRSAQWHSSRADRAERGLTFALFAGVVVCILLAVALLGWCGVWR